jgi:hypothetical protein
MHGCSDSFNACCFCIERSARGHGDRCDYSQYVPRSYWIDICYNDFVEKKKKKTTNIMIKKLKLQKAVIVFILGVIALIVYQVLAMREIKASIYVLELAGFFFIAGALMFLYPILFAKKDREGNVQLNPDKQMADDAAQESHQDLNADHKN